MISFGLEKVSKASGNVGVVEERVVKPIEEFSLTEMTVDSNRHESMPFINSIRP